MKHLIVIAGIIFTGNAFCQNWATDASVNNPIAVASASQELSNITTDGKGGAIICWRDFRSGLSTDIYAQRISATGAILWTTNGIPVCNTNDDQYEPTIISDGMGGAIIAWYDTRVSVGGAVGLYMQKIDSTGAIKWTTDGVEITPDSVVSDPAEMLSDGAGGAYIVWEDIRAESGITGDIYMQKINSSGVVQWQPKGIAVCKASGDQQYPSIVTDNAGGAIIIWEDSRMPFDLDIYAQRINASGNSLWTGNGIKVSMGPANDTYPVSVANGLGGAIIAWTAGTDAIKWIQNINNSGALTWNANGVGIDTLLMYSYKLQICTDGDAGAYLTWESLVTPVSVQHIDKNGQIWDSAKPVTNPITGMQKMPVIISDGAEGAIIAWEDERDGFYNSHIMAQRFNKTGSMLWGNDGLYISKATSLTTDYDDKRMPRMVSDTKGGAILCWDDLRANDGFRDIYAQRVGAQGIQAPVSSGLRQTEKITNPTIQIFPNPFHSFTNIQTGYSGPCTLTVTDFNGRELTKIEINESNFKLERGEWKAGMYILKCMDAQGNLSASKLIIE